MKRGSNKWILLAYGLLWVAWLSWNPSTTVDSQMTEPPSIEARPASLQTPLPGPGTSSFEGEDPNCQRCHSHPERLKVNIKDPACLECHLPDDDRIQVYDDNSQSPRAIPVSFSPGSKPNEMIHIPAGIFMMGRSDRTTAEGRGNRDEIPIHKVYVAGFYMDKYEVTNLQYKAFVDTMDHRTPRHWKEDRIPQGKDDHPVNYVSWFDSNDYCHWVGKRLPTEAEWEKAARGAKGLRFPWGDTFDAMKANIPQRWLALEQEGDTMPIGSFENGKSPYGLYDMAGNLYEWTTNWYKPYPNNPETNVHYGEKNKIVRGGSWYDCLSYGCGLSAPTFNRSRFAPIIRNKSFGFRCAKSG